MKVLLIFKVCMFGLFWPFLGIFPPQIRFGVDISDALVFIPRHIKLKLVDK